MEHWCLRSFRKTSEMDGFTGNNDTENQLQQFLTTKKTKTVIIDGQEVQYELVKDVSRPPEVLTETKDHSKIHFINTNVKREGTVKSLEDKCRRFLMSFGIFSLTLGYLIVFVAVNAIFAALWVIQSDSKCCADPAMTFAQNFDFAIQTSTTIGYGGYWPRGTRNYVVVTDYP